MKKTHEEENNLKLNIEDDKIIEEILSAQKSDDSKLQKEVEELKRQWLK